MDFLEEYIHLEKLCNDIYGTKHGISKYIEDMETAPYVMQSRIPLWGNTYRKLKELRWKRNQYVHEGKAEFDEEDAKWLSEFYQDIINGKDPLSQKRVLPVETARNRNLGTGYSTSDTRPDWMQKEVPSAGWGWFLAVFIVFIIISILTVALFL